MHRWVNAQRLMHHLTRVAALALFLDSCNNVLTPTLPATDATKVVSASVTPTNTTLPTLTVEPTKTSTPTPVNVVSTNPLSSPGKLDMNTIFPLGKGRDLVLDNCMSCHGFVRVIIGQRTHAQWQYVKQMMRSRVIGLSDEEVEILFAYLEENFNDTKPAPELPAWFLESFPW